MTCKQIPLKQITDFVTVTVKARKKKKEQILWWFL